MSRVVFAGRMLSSLPFRQMTVVDAVSPHPGSGHCSKLRDAGEDVAAVRCFDANFYTDEGGVETQ